MLFSELEVAWIFIMDDPISNKALMNLVSDDLFSMKLYAILTGICVVNRESLLVQLEKLLLEEFVHACHN